MQVSYFFPTPVWNMIVDYDNDKLLEEIYEFKKTTPCLLYTSDAADE